MPRACMEKFVAVPCGSAGLEQTGKLFGVSEPALVRRLAELGLQGYDVGTSACVNPLDFRNSASRVLLLRSVTSRDLPSGWPHCGHRQ